MATTFRPASRAFSLIELIVVIILIGTLAGLVLMGALAARDRNVAQAETLAWRQILEAAGADALDRGTFITAADIQAVLDDDPDLSPAAVVDGSDLLPGQWAYLLPTSVAGANHLDGLTGHGWLLARPSRAPGALVVGHVQDPTTIRTSLTTLPDVGPLPQASDPSDIQWSTAASSSLCAPGVAYTTIYDPQPSGGTVESAIADGPSDPQPMVCPEAQSAGGDLHPGGDAGKDVAPVG